MEEEKERIQLKKRFQELAEKSYRQNLYTFTGFLGLSEQEDFWQSTPSFVGVSFQLFGGVEDCERKMVRFGSVEALGYEEEYPIECIKISPGNEKFAENLTHRDYLGAFMNQGIERTMIGDLFPVEKECYAFVHSQMADYLCDNLQKVKHTNVRCRKTLSLSEYPVKEPVELALTVSSQRIDGMIAKVYQMSRNQSMELFTRKRIFVNGRLVENNSKALKEGDVVTVRGFGKFIYRGIRYETKKGKQSVLVGKV